MGSFEIGISGLQAAQTALEVIGNNIANAATEGYHRQEVELRPVDDLYTDGFLIGQGVELEAIVRQYNRFIEEQIVSQESNIAQLTKELEGLSILESAFGELTTAAISTAIDDFFNSLHQLSERPTEVVYQNEVITCAESLAYQLRNLGSTISDLEERVYSEAQTAVEKVNILGSQIAELNGNIYMNSVKGNDVGNMCDQRDQLITELSRLVGITTYARDYNVVDVVVLDTPLVIGEIALELQIGLVANGENFDLGIAPADTTLYNTQLTGGELGGLFRLRNELIRGIGDDLDTLAQTIISETNKLHVQGVGSEGSFERLLGWTMASEDISDFVPPVVDGETIYVRVTDLTTGAVIRYEIPVDTSDTLTDITADFAAITGLSGSQVNAGRLEIVADANYEFDFLPGVLAAPMENTVAEPNNNTMTGNVPEINISGLYTGTDNLVYTCTINGTGTVGLGNLTITVDDGVGGTVTLNVGDGYVAGTVLEADNGIKISLGPGELNNGEHFRISAVANSDASGLLAATGVNCFFSGIGASSIDVCDFVKDNTGYIAVSKTVEMTDNANALAMARLGDTAMSALGQLTPKAFYRQIATNIGNDISVGEMREENAQGVWRNLCTQRDEISGVDINDEATKMLVFERMFQAMAKYIDSVSESLDTLMELML